VDSTRIARILARGYTQNVTVDERVEAARRFLLRLILASRITREEIDRRLGWSRGATSRLLTGNAKLTYRHILLLLGVLNVTPDFFFSTLHGRGSRAARRGAVRLVDLGALVELIGGVWPPPAPPEAAGDVEVDRDELEAQIESAVRQILRGDSPEDPDSADEPDRS
jgi:transcriptional regulator with XRE-family HTH domain